jgi:hypothetical protein
MSRDSAYIGGQHSEETIVANKTCRTNRHKHLNFIQHPFNRAGGRTSNVVRRAKQGASYQVKDLLFQNLVCRTIISYTKQNARVKYAHGPSDSHSFA